MPVVPGRSLDVVIIGAGFAGIYALYKARKAGFSARAFDGAAGVGGTWFHNRYPGARVDIQSMEYSYSFSEELQQDWRWTERYASQPEILAYANHVVDRFGLREHIQLASKVNGAKFDESEGRWCVKSAGGESWSARFLVVAAGPLSAPNAPAFPGLESFEGQLLHTAAWPTDPVTFTGKRVAVIGTGSSGVQVIPMLAEQADELIVFQRTASYVVPAHNSSLDPAYEARVKSDYAAFRARNRATRFGFGSDLPPNDVSALLVSDEELEERFEERWKIGGFSFLGAFNDLATNARANAHAAEFVRRKIRETVNDPKTARKLSPDHVIGCKRLCVGTNYYETFNRPNVRLIDLRETPLDSIVASGALAGGHLHEVDVIVLATGFDAMTGALMQLELIGRGGLSIQRKWEAGPSNYLGLSIAGFPNLFNIAGPGSTLPFTNAFVCIEQQVDWIFECMSSMIDRGHSTIEATEEAEAEWVTNVNEKAKSTLFLTCNSWYLGANIPGKPRMFMASTSGFSRYAQRCAEVAKRGYEGFLMM